MFIAWLHWWQMWAFIMTVTSITVESSGLAFCHLCATSLPGQSVQNKCRTGSRPSNCSPPQTNASVNTDFSIKSVAQSKTPLCAQNQPTCLSNHVLFTFITFHYWLSHTLKHNHLGSDFSVNSHARYKTVYKNTKLSFEMTAHILILVCQLAFSENWAQAFP